MKKTHFILVAAFVLLVVTVLAISPSKAVSQKRTPPKGSAIPNDVAEILKKSCIGCHNTDGNHMAMSMWNFSEWNNYTAKKQAKKATAMCNAITKGIMPPASVRNANPDKIPTTTQIEIVCKWSKSLNAK
jgi:hypothetical protein